MSGEWEVRIASAGISEVQCVKNPKLSLLQRLVAGRCYDSSWIRVQFVSDATKFSVLSLRLCKRKIVCIMSKLWRDVACRLLIQVRHGETVTNLK